MDNTIQLYVDKKKEIKGYPITSPDRVIDENGVNIKDYVEEAINNAQLGGGDTQVNLSDYAKKTDLHDHSNKTILDSITTSKITEWNNKSDFSGNYNDLTNKPTIPTKVSELTNDEGYLTTVPSEYITETELNSKGYLTQHQDISHKADKTELHSHSNKSVLDSITTSKVTEWDNKSNFSGNYNDLTNKPTTFEPSSHSHSINDISDYPNDLVTKDYVDDAINNAKLEGGVSLNLRDVLDGEIFTIGTTDTPTTPTATYGQIVVSKSYTTITEGSTDTFTIKLDKAPTNNQVVTLNKNNSDVTLSSYSLTFTPNNYSTAQTVTITVAEDNTDYSNETCTITLSSPNVSTKTLIVNITDNDTEVNEPDTPEEPTPTNYINYIYNSDTFTVPTNISQHPIPETAKAIYWQSYKATKTVSDGVATVLFNGDGFFQCRPFTGNGKTYYCSYLVDTASTAYVTCIIKSGNPQYVKDLGNGWTLYASIVTDSETYETNKIEDNRTSDWTPIQTKEWMKICLTEVYPDGNYPSVERCSNIFNYVSGIIG